MNRLEYDNYHAMGLFGGQDSDDGSREARQMARHLRRIAMAARRLADFAADMAITEEGHMQLYSRPGGSSGHLMEALSRLEGKLREAQSVADRRRFR